MANLEKFGRDNFGKSARDIPKMPTILKNEIVTGKKSATGKKNTG